MPNHEKNVLLVVNMFHLLQTNHFGDGQRFQRQIFPRVTVPDKNHTTKCAGTYKDRRKTGNIFTVDRSRLTLGPVTGRVYT